MKALLILLIVSLSGCTNYEAKPKPQVISTNRKVEYENLNDNDLFEIEVKVLSNKDLEVTYINNSDSYVELQPADLIEINQNGTWTEVISWFFDESDGHSPEFIGVDANDRLTTTLNMTEELSPGQYRYIKTIFPTYTYGSYSAEFEVGE